jgi:hypothetical protein
MKQYMLSQSDKEFILKAISDSHSKEIAYDIGIKHLVGVDELVKHIIESREIKNESD